MRNLKKKLENDKTLKKRTNLNVDDIMEFVLETTYLRIEGEIYQQKSGVAMGSLVPPIVMNLYMEDAKFTRKEDGSVKSIVYRK